MTTDFLHPIGGPIVGPNLGEICKYLYILGKIMKYGGGGGMSTPPHSVNKQLTL